MHQFNHQKEHDALAANLDLIDANESITAEEFRNRLVSYRPSVSTKYLEEFVGLGGHIKHEPFLGMSVTMALPRTRQNECKIKSN